jgi:hypothetical protein
MSRGTTPRCSEYGDHDKCLSDWQDFIKQQQELTPTPN